MDLQASEFPPATETRPRSRTPTQDTLHSEPEEQLSASSPAFRFPRPQGSVHLANWISSSSPDIMQPSNVSDAGSLTDSSYEIIHTTDGESQEDHLTESTCSLSATQPEDVHSLDGSVNHYNTDSEAEPAHSSHASSIRYTDQALHNPSTQLPTTTSLEYGSSTEGSGVVVRSIELQETDDADAVLADKILAKHVIHELTPEESAGVASTLGLQEAPERLVVSIRQTMSQSCLSTQEPLRVLYVGRAEAQRSIVLKICGAIWASPRNGSQDQDYFDRHRDGVYNIVPISSFGPTPELDLMEASQYQIKVEHCTSAEKVLEEEQGSSASYKITIDQDKSYQSSFTPATGLVVQPKWELPHIAVFFISDEDDAEAERTRDAAYAFTERHGVPSIFVADQQKFDDYGCFGEYIDEHTVHLCLESRDPDRPMAARRFPIDLASFSDIDARQMNRNLAYLTGLTESQDEGLEQTATLLEKASASGRTTMEETKRTSVSADGSEDWKTLIGTIYSNLQLPFFLLWFFLFFLLGVPWLQSKQSLHSTESATATGVCSLSSTQPKVFTTQSTSVITTTQTVVVNVTSTSTVQVSQVKPSTSTLASALSFAGFLSEKPSSLPAAAEVKKATTSPNKNVCSVRRYSPTEILVEIPSRNKAAWLAHGAINIAVRRGDDLLEAKISPADEGVLVELTPKDAHGMLNLTVLTTRRPKINETFQIDLGNKAATEVFQAGFSMMRSALDKASWDAWSEDAKDKLRGACSLPLGVASALEQASGALLNRTTNSTKRATGEVRKYLASGVKTAESMAKLVDLNVLQAQIASKLWWLKMQGRLDEHAEYERKAHTLLEMKYQELLNSAEETAGTLPEKPKLARGFPSRLLKSWKKMNPAPQDEGVKEAEKAAGHWAKQWKKLMGGM